MPIVRTLLSFVALVAILLLASPALADPPPGVTPPDSAAVGIATGDTQYVCDQFSADYNATTPPNDLYCWNEQNPYTLAIGDTIVPKQGCPPVTRPSGPQPALAALEANQEPTGNTTYYCIDFVMLDRNREASDPPYAPGGVAFVSMFGNALTWATRDAASGGTNAPASLTAAQLTGIYNCTDTNWDQVGGKNASIDAYIPQSGSSTRAAWLAALGLATPGSCVSDLPTESEPGGTLEQDEGINNVFDSPDAIVPFSVAPYIAQAYHSPKCTKTGCGEVGPTTPPCTPKAGQNEFGCDETGYLGLNEINGVAPTTPWPLKRATKNPAINPEFPAGFQHGEYAVVRYDPNTADHIPGGESGAPGGIDLERIFGANGWICTSATARKDIKDYGFLPLSGCGSTD
jgi:hypothetical protein